MNVTVVDLRSAGAIRFPDGVTAKVRGIERETPGGRVCADISLEFEARSPVVLIDVVEDGQTNQGPRLYAIEGTPSAGLLLLGGPRAYLSGSSGMTSERFQLHRDWKDTEYWDTHFVPAGADLIVVYEAGVFALSADLAIRWHRRKYFNDFLVRLGGGRLHFLRDHDYPWTLLLDDGTIESGAGGPAG